eukprot:TRINITY_DN32217_c0_g1_i1.p1 TRINITY_DN32217_c0_g1~~TRINITY_DN32217_c0_g1_i1.p1  ORF type:complete len:503 (-),score=129.63 TRINITY_DN32217_c0_g1_i1:301-1809(-)
MAARAGAGPPPMSRLIDNLRERGVLPTSTLQRQAPASGPGLANPAAASMFASMPVAASRPAPAASASSSTTRSRSRTPRTVRAAEPAPARRLLQPERTPSDPALPQLGAVRRQPPPYSPAPERHACSARTAAPGLSQQQHHQQQQQQQQETAASLRRHNSATAAHGLEQRRSVPLADAQLVSLGLASAGRSGSAGAHDLAAEARLVPDQSERESKLRAEGSALRARLREMEERFKEMEERNSQLQHALHNALMDKQASDKNFTATKEERDSLRMRMKNYAQRTIEMEEKLEKANGQNEVLREEVDRLRAAANIQRSGVEAPSAKKKSGGRSRSTAKAARPAVPVFEEPPDPAIVLRKIPLPPKKDEDNCEIAGPGDELDEADLDNDDADSQDKPVPAWCSTYLDVLSKQVAIDPDTIFGNRVPACVTADIFPDGLYATLGQDPPKRRRGSSGDWGQDRLTRGEVRDYKKRMGQLQSWDPKSKDLRVNGAALPGVQSGACGGS